MKCSQQEGSQKNAYELHKAVANCNLILPQVVPEKQLCYRKVFLETVTCCSSIQKSDVAKDPRLSEGIIVRQGMLMY